MTLYGNDRDKLSVPFVRPEDDALFKNLATTNVAADTPKLNAAAPEFVSGEKPSTPSSRGAELAVAGQTKTSAEEATDTRLGPRAVPATETTGRPPQMRRRRATPIMRPKGIPPEPRVSEPPSLGKDATVSSRDAGGGTRRESNTAIWGPWRHGPSAGGAGGAGGEGGLPEWVPAREPDESGA